VGLAGRQDLLIPFGWMPAAGALGFAPPGEWPLPEPPVVFVTNPVCLDKRSPAKDRVVIAYGGGLLLHTGWPNPGLRAVLKTFRLRWSRANVPIWVHIMVETAHQADQMVRQLEDVEGVMAIELGLPPECSANEACGLVEAAQGEMPLILSLPIDRVGEPWVEQLGERAISAISLSAPRGILPAIDGSMISGRLYGPGLLPQALRTLQRLKPLGLPLIVGSGVYRRTDIRVALEGGAAAVQLDSVLWRGWDEQECV